jgi:hypothetical protein
MAFCCNNLSGILDSCNSVEGGIASAYIACYDAVKGATVSTDTGEIVSIVGSSTGATPVWKEYNFRVDTANYVATGARSDSGMYMKTSVITLQFIGADSEKKLEVDNLSNSDVAIILESANGEYEYFGLDRPVNLTGDTLNSGTAQTDMKGFTLTFTDISRGNPKNLSAAAISQLIGTPA